MHGKSCPCDMCHKIDLQLIVFLCFIIYLTEEPGCITMKRFYDYIAVCLNLVDKKIKKSEENPYQKSPERLTQKPAGSLSTVLINPIRPKTLGINIRL